MPEYATIVIRRSVEEVLQAHGRQILETEALPVYVPKRRWFASKGEHITDVTIAYGVPLPGAPEVLLSEIEVKLGDRTERYVLPLAIGWEDETTGALAQQLALARIRRGRRMGVLTDGFAVDSFALGVLKHLNGGAPIALPDGELRFMPTSRMADLDVVPGAELRRFSAEQSNSSLVVGDAVVLKIVRHALSGIHPEGEMTRYLTEKDYQNIAPLFGEVVRVDRTGIPSTLMLVQGFVRNQGDGWTWTIDFLARALEELAVIGADAMEAHEDAFATYEVFATAMGKRLAELHAVWQPRPTSQIFDRSGPTIPS